jgi:hypothetical protein
LKPAFGIRLALIALLLGSVTACQRRSAAARYLYVVTCDASVYKYDTVENRREASYDLSQAPGAQQFIPADHGGLNGCLAYQAEFDPAASVFYIVAASQARVKPDGTPDGTKDYRVLGFSVPAIGLVKNMPAGSNLTDPPHLELGSDSALKLTPAAEWRPPTDIDVSTFAPNREKLFNQIIDRSGDRALLRIFVADPKELSLAVADTKSKTVVRLQSPPPATALRAHLAPGGEAVLIEATAVAGDPTKTGRLALFDANTGSLLEEISDPRVRDQYFLAISPNGRAVYHTGDAYSFVDLKRSFPATPVGHVLDSSNPAIFFADR